MLTHPSRLSASALAGSPLLGSILYVCITFVARLQSLQCSYCIRLHVHYVAHTLQRAWHVAMYEGVVQVGKHRQLARSLLLPDMLVVHVCIARSSMLGVAVAAKLDHGDLSMLDGCLGTAFIVNCCNGIQW